MKKRSEMITLPCDCKCCMFVIEKTMWEDGEVHYNITVQDSRYDHGYNSLWGRLKRAAKTLFGKPIYYNDVFLGGEDTFKKLVADMDRLTKAEFKEEGAA